MLGFHRGDAMQKRALKKPGSRGKSGARVSMPGEKQVPWAAIGDGGVPNPPPVVNIIPRQGRRRTRQPTRPPATPPR